MTTDGFLIALLLLATGAAGFAALAALTARRRQREAEANAAAARKRLELLVEYAPIGLALVRHDGSIRHANIVCRDLLGYTADEVRTLDDWWARAFPDPALRAQAADTARAMAAQSRETCAASGPSQFAVTCRDGTRKSLAFHYVDFGTIGLWTMTDVTDYTRIEEAARLANDHLLAQLAENRRLQEALREQAIRDPLTALFNRRYLDETLDRELARAVREGYPVAILMIDIDHFKRLNDTYGHLAGDEMLKTLAGQLTATARQEDIVCRFGGEEFAVVLPRMPIEVACSRAETWRAGFADTVVHFGEFELRATLSVGIAAFPGHGRQRDTLIDAADQALYEAKALGRNCVVVASPANG